MVWISRDDFQDFKFSSMICTKGCVTLTAVARPYLGSISYQVRDPVDRRDYDFDSIEDAIAKFNDILGFGD